MPQEIAVVRAACPASIAYASPELPLDFLEQPVPKLPESGSPCSQKVFDVLEDLVDITRPKLFLVKLGQSDTVVERLTHQLSLNFLPSSFLVNDVSQFANYRSRARLGLMRKSLWSLVVRIPTLREFARELEKSGIVLIGDAVQLTREELQFRSDASAKTLDRFEQILADADLNLGQRIANWQSLRRGIDR